MKLKYGIIFANQSQSAAISAETQENKLIDRSENDTTFEKNRSVNKLKEQAETSPKHDSQKLNSDNIRILEVPLPCYKGDMDRDYFNWEASAEMMEIIKSKMKARKHYGWCEKD